PAVQLIQIQVPSKASSSNVDARLRQDRRASIDIVVKVAAHHAKPQLAVFAELAADIDAGLGIVHTQAGKARVAVEQVDRPPFDADSWRHEQVLPLIERLVQFGGQPAGAAYLQVGAPFCAEGGEPGL